jgi:hypothetical protein
VMEIWYDLMNLMRNFIIHKALKIVQLEKPDLIPPETDVTVMYGVFRSLRRGSLSRATEEGLKGTDLDMIVYN